MKTKKLKGIIKLACNIEDMKWNYMSNEDWDIYHDMMVQHDNCYEEVKQQTIISESWAGYYEH